MFDPFDSHNSYDYDQSSMLVPYVQFEPWDERDEVLEAVSRFAGLFALGIVLPLLVRWVPGLRARNVKLVALAIAAGHWDLINHSTQHIIQQAEGLTR